MNYLHCCLLVLVCVCVVSANAGDGLVLLVATPAHIVGSFTQGDLTLHFNSEVGKLALEDTYGDEIVYVDHRTNSNATSVFGVVGETTEVVGARLYALAEFNLIIDASFALGARGITGLLYPAALPIYATAMNLDRSKPVHRKPARDASTCTALTQDNDGATDCLGLCGDGCDCWEIVCGDCCWHNGCFCHDICCTPTYWYIYCLVPASFSCTVYSCPKNAAYAQCQT